MLRRLGTAARRAGFTAGHRLRKGPDFFAVKPSRDDANARMRNISYQVLKAVMPTLTVRDIPEDIYRRLKELAGHNRRSMSNEIVTLLEHALLPRTIESDTFIEEARTFHARFKETLPDLTEQAKRAERTNEKPAMNEGSAATNANDGETSR